MIIEDKLFNVELQDILSELVSQLRANNIPLLQKMKDGPTHIQVQCPYHSNGQERKPSAGIRKEDGMFHCFACQTVHTLPEVISHCFDYDDYGAFGWQWLLKNFATVAIEERKDVKLDFVRGNTDKKIVGRYKNFVTEEELDKYRYTHPYLYQRGMTDDIIEMFDLGYDASTETITFPVKDIRGRCLFVARRSIKSKYFSYPEGVEKPLYGLYEYYCMFSDSKQQYFDLWVRVNPAANEVIVCESMLDALSFWTVGKYAVALNGLGNELQFKQLRQLPCREIILATDMDERGLSARKRIRKNVPNKLIAEYFFPKGRKDANECTKEELLNLRKEYV